MAAARQPMAPERLATVVAHAAIDAGRLLLATDFDGSVSPIARTPGAARPLRAADNALAWLSRRGAGRGAGAWCATRVAVITARDSDDAASRMALGPEAIVAGNYGLERFYRGRITVVRAAARWVPALDKAQAALRAELAAGRSPGARLERKRCGIVLHTRGVRRRGAATEAIALAAEVSSRLHLGLIVGKQAVEIHVPVERDKGSALQALHRGIWAEAAVCAAGDDVGDIPMLRFANSLGERGVSVAISDPETPGAVLGTARHAVNGPKAWAVTLERLVDLLQR
jgi:trehalose-phosphatase